MIQSSDLFKDSIFRPKLGILGKKSKSFVSNKKKGKLEAERWNLNFVNLLCVYCLGCFVWQVEVVNHKWNFIMIFRSASKKLAKGAFKAQSISGILYLFVTSFIFWKEALKSLMIIVLDPHIRFLPLTQKFGWWNFSNKGLLTLPLII